MNFVERLPESLPRTVPAPEILIVLVVNPLESVKVVVPAVAVTIPAGVNCSVVVGDMDTSPVVVHGTAPPTLLQVAEQAGGVPVSDCVWTWYVVVAEVNVTVYGHPVMMV